MNLDVFNVHGQTPKSRKLPRPARRYLAMAISWSCSRETPAISVAVNAYVSHLLLCRGDSCLDDALDSVV